ncbi:MAG: CCA tRNA nucleotidyltransferase [Eubacterium sp.]|nr:CCA tRNA nucleotidyltransferase [Eubacterium sp.]
MEITMPRKVAEIINELNTAGYEAYAVGGCVRDSILGREPSDWDITTSAMPEEVKAIFRRTVDTGIKHGTVTVLLGDDAFEVTTFRVDGEYTDHRHPEEVSFTRNLREDLLRRDFTINAMAYSDKTGIVDLYGGLEDIENKVIKAVGDPDARFDEDALRIMRAVRFAAQLDFTIEENTRQAIGRHTQFLKEVSAERIETELTKLIISDHPEKLIDAYELGITGVILPEFDMTMGVPQNNPYHRYDVGRHIIAVMQNTPATKKMRYTALFHDISKPECRTTDERGIDHFKMHAVLGADKAREIMRRLKMDNDTIYAVTRLIYWHDYGIKGDVTKRSLRRMMSKLGAENFPDYLAIRRADMAGQSDFRKEEKDEIYRNIEALYEEIIAEGDCLTIKDLAVNGGDIMKLGIPAGPKIGEILSYLLERVMDDPSLNEKSDLITLAETYEMK